ncbi:hypothetical protein, partial [Sphingomonas trueperi]|uniref:hypothetical protein n=1 Tax=Sphingomonas trueperi TaxID=53317 RepID=UPI003397E528
ASANCLIASRPANVPTSSRPLDINGQCEIALKFSASDFLGWARRCGMKASIFTDAQKAFVIE